MPMPIGAKNPSGFVDDARLDSNGSLKVGLFGGNTNAAQVIGNMGDGFGTAGPFLAAASLGYLFNGTNLDRARTPNVFKTITAVAVTAATPVTVWTPAGGKKFRLMGFMLSLTVAGSVLLIDNATEIIRTPLMAAGVGLAAPPMGNGYLSAAINQLLKIDVSATGSVSGFVYGTEE